ncbi:MAG: hypothetical protein AAFQ82_23685 [Myxococcota bacterium]
MSNVTRYSAAVSQRLLGHRQLGFGESVDGAETVEMHIPLNDILTSLESHYDEFVVATKDMWPDESDPEDLLELAGYPAFREVVEREELLWFVLRECLVFDFLEEFAGAENPKWFVHDLLSLCIVDGVVQVRGLMHQVMRT